MPSKRNASLLDRLKSVRADLARLNAYTADSDKPMEVAVSNVRNKWSRVMEVLDEIQWTTIEALDKKGSVLLVHNRGPADERPAGDLEELAGTAAGEAGKVSALLAVSVHWVLRAQDVALTRQQEASSSLMEAHNKIVESTMRRFEQMDAQYNEMLRLNHAMHGQRFAEVEAMIRAARERLADDEGTQSSKLLEVLAPEFAKAVLAKPSAGDKKPNGVPTKKAPAAAE